MGNSKEVLVLIILILVMLVSTVRAEEGGTANLAEPAEAGQMQRTADLDKPSDMPIFVDLKLDATTCLGVASASTLSEIDDYGLVLTLSTQF